jgi:hypothetical protein
VLDEGLGRSDDAVSFLLNEPDLLRANPKIARQLTQVTQRSIAPNQSARVNRSIEALKAAKGSDSPNPVYDSLIASLDKLRASLTSPVPTGGIRLRTPN